MASDVLYSSEVGFLRKSYIGLHLLSLLGWSWNKADGMSLSSTMTSQRSFQYRSIYVRMYYRSRTAGRCCFFAVQTLREHSPVTREDGTFLHEVTSWPPSWKYDVISEIRLRQSMHIYLRNNPTKFHPDPISTETDLFSRGHPARTRTRWTTWVAIRDQFQIQK